MTRRHASRTDGPSRAVPRFCSDGNTFSCAPVANRLAGARWRAPGIRGALIAAVLALGGAAAGPAMAQISDGVVKIGVLNDQSGPNADLGGPGSVVAARMAAEDFGGTVLGKPVAIVFADHQNKADIGAAIARQWFDQDHVDMVVDFSNSSVALAVEQLAKDKNRIAIANAVGTTDFTGKACTATEASWLYDMYLAQVKTPAESKGPWDDYKIVATIPGDEAFQSLAAGGCPLAQEH
jgi:branched-chain amino acid transport system substrate-binding protein